MSFTWRELVATYVAQVGNGCMDYFQVAAVLKSK